MKVLLIGLLMLAGLCWQVIMCANEDKPRRVIPAVVVGCILLVGILVDSFIEVFLDDKKRMSFLEASIESLFAVFRVLVLAVSLVAKSYLAPLTFAFTLSCVVYFQFTYGELHRIPLVQGLFDWVFSGAPRWLSWTYVSIVAGYSLGSAIHDTDFG